MRSINRIGRYRVERLLGSGAFASVWLAHDEDLDSAVAIKVLADNWSRHPDVRDRFLAEAQLLRKADSDRILRALDIGELEDGRPYFVTNFANLGSLEERLDEGELSIDQALRIAVETAKAVCVLHDIDVVHRDLKPSNVLFQRGKDGADERLVLADLGLAKAIAQSSGLTVMAGSPGYMAPEQARPGGEIDVRTDVYGLGALTHRLLTGVTPRTDGGAVVPRAIERVIERALRVDPRRRWPTMRAFTDRLEALAQRRWKRRRGWHLPRLARGRPLAAGAVAVLLIALGLGFWGWKSATNSSRHVPIAAACQDDDISILDGGVGPSPNPDDLGFAFLITARQTVQGPISCTIKGYLTDIRFLDATGKQLPVEGQKFVSDPPKRLTIEPDVNAEIDMRWKGTLKGGTQVTPAILEFRLPGSHQVTQIAWQGGPLYTNQPVFFSAAIPAVD